MDIRRWIIVDIQNQLEYLEKQVEELKEAVLKTELRTRNHMNTLYFRFQDRTLRQKRRPMLSAFAVNILDHCNLNCKGCDNFSCIADEKFVSLNSIIKDLSQMSALTQENVMLISISGGEPLLHPNLPEILENARKYFPHTLIEVVTNGILLLNKDRAFWDTCKENNIGIVVTKYPIELNHEEIEKTAKENHVNFRYQGNTKTVVKTMDKIFIDTTAYQNVAVSFWNCPYVNKCQTLKDGKFYPCPILANAEIFNRQFDLNMKIYEEDSLDIHKTNNLEDLLSYLCKPKSFCCYCNTVSRTKGNKWEVTKKCITEWT